MSSAKRISVEEIIQQVEDEDLDFFFEGSDEDFGLNSSSDDEKSDDEDNDVDIGNDDYGDKHDNTDNEIRTHGVSDSKNIKL